MASRASKPPTGPPGPSPSRLDALAELTHCRWSLPLVDLCAQSEVGGHKYVTFIHRLGISRDSLGRTLASLITLGYLRSNPGVQHALRPEYILTPAGRRIGPATAGIMAELRRLGAEDLGLQKWTLPIVAALGGGVRRFGDIRGLLGGASPRAVSLALRDMEEAGMIRRDVRDTYPPSAEYALAKKSLRLAVAVRRLLAAIGLRAAPARQGPQSEPGRKRRSA